MIDITNITPLANLSNKNLNKTVYTDGIIRNSQSETKLVEPAEYTPSTSRFRLTFPIDASETETKLVDSAYILGKGELKATAETPTYDDIQFILTDCTLFEPTTEDGSLSVRKTASVIEDIFDEYDTGIGLPKRFVIEQAKHKDASHKTAVETINRLVTDGQIFEPKTGFISYL